jgi:hypothetical protein
MIPGASYLDFKEISRVSFGGPFFVIPPPDTGCMTQNQLRLIPELNSNRAANTRGNLRSRRSSSTGFNPINLTLIEGSVQADFGIDERTRNIGLSGIAAAREMLRQANEALAA